MIRQASASRSGSSRFSSTKVSQWLCTSSRRPDIAARSRPISIDAFHGDINESEASDVRRNEIGIQLLSPLLHRQLFPDTSPRSSPAQVVTIAREHLQSHGIYPARASSSPSHSFTLPPLQGQNLDEHFHRIGSEAAEPWLSLAKGLAETKLPRKPRSWVVQSGWTKYSHDGSAQSVDHPNAEALVFDVETLPEISPYAIMATAATSSAWYVWISPWLLGETEDVHQLIPLGDPSTPRVIVGYHVGYDRARVREEYALQGTQNRFIDALSLHMAVKGIAPRPRQSFADDARKELYDATMEQIRQGKMQVPPFCDEDSVNAEMNTRRWNTLTSWISLADVAEMHCGIYVDKELRNDFLTSSREDLARNIEPYLAYCLQDTAVTHSVFRSLLPQFLERCPHPVSFAALLPIGSAFLPVDESWPTYLARADEKCKEIEQEMKVKLAQLVQDAKDLASNDGKDEEGKEKWRNDVWLNQLNWTMKSARKSKSASQETKENLSTEHTQEPETPRLPRSKNPAWHASLIRGPMDTSTISQILPLLLRLTLDGHPLQRNTSEGWHYAENMQVTRLPTAEGSKAKVLNVLSKRHGLPLLLDGRMKADDLDLAIELSNGIHSLDIITRVLRLATNILEEADQAMINEDPWLKNLDWSEISEESEESTIPQQTETKSRARKDSPEMWPQWYWELTKPAVAEVTTRSQITPLLMRLSWLGWPLFRSKDHGWIFRVPNDADFAAPFEPLEFQEDGHLKEQSQNGFSFYRLPHQKGTHLKVGSPLGKSFVGYAQDGTMQSAVDLGKEVLEMLTLCDHWASIREDVINQMVVWNNEPKFFPGTSKSERKTPWGMILPPIISMGTVTRRAIERTWVTNDHARADRVGSELKSMVHAPKGYAIVGADVDSGEPWISSLLGDAQFGLHGATAHGWMAIEGNRSSCTDLHSIIAERLYVTRDQAKVINYARLYGAGLKPAQKLLLQAKASIWPEAAREAAERLYTGTKGTNIRNRNAFERLFWFGGPESFTYSRLEELARSPRPHTPVLACGVPYALSKEFLKEEFGSDYVPSRINWLIQSSGVDYLHLMIVSMENLIRKYDIKARYIISIHDELRYLVAEEDRFRAALALQIANLWTRSLFAHKMGLDDLPQGVAFLSSVDIDNVLRRYPELSCVTPSQPEPIPAGKSLDIARVLSMTNDGSLWADGRSMDENAGKEHTPTTDLTWLRAQAAVDLAEAQRIAQVRSGELLRDALGDEEETDAGQNESEILHKPWYEGKAAQWR